MSTPRSSRRAPRVVLGSLLIASTLALGACSDDDDGDDMDPDDGDPVTDVNGPEGETSMPAPGTDPDAMPDMTPVTYVIPLTVEEEIPAPTGEPNSIENAMGEANLTFDPATRGITGTVTTSGLSGPPQAAHIHEQGFDEDNQLQPTGGVIVPFIADGSGTGFVLADDAILTEEQAESLETGLLYVNVHTAQNEAGEIRGQIVMQDEEETETEVEIETGS